MSKLREFCAAAHYRSYVLCYGKVFIIASSADTVLLLSLGVDLFCASTSSKPIVTHRALCSHAQAWPSAGGHQALFSAACLVVNGAGGRAALEFGRALWPSDSHRSAGVPSAGL